MKKEYLYILLIVAVFGLVIAGILLFSSDNKTTGSVTSSGTSLFTSEEQKYAEFTADLVCQLASANEENMFEVLAGIEDLASDYGFTAEEIEALSPKYINDVNFAEKVLDEIEKDCPSFYSEIASNFEMPGV